MQALCGKECPRVDRPCTHIKSTGYGYGVNRLLRFTRNPQPWNFDGRAAVHDRNNVAIFGAFGGPGIYHAKLHPDGFEVRESR